MPLRARSPCPYAGCGALTSGGYCETHKALRLKAVDQQRGNSTARGYDSRWRKARDGWLRSHPLCGDRRDGASVEHSACAREERVTPASVVDHIIPHRGDKALFWFSGNWQSLCKACHDVKTAREDGGFGNRSRG